jgi:hypothetical protein
MPELQPTLRRLIPEVTVSLTSHHQRVQTVDQVIRTLLEQTWQPDRVILYLSEESADLGALPSALTGLVEESAGRFDIQVVPELGPHRKYLYAMQEHPDDIVITVDDDNLYPPDLVETLLAGYLRYPFAVSAMRCHQMAFDDSGHLLPYDQWRWTIKGARGLSPLYFATGVGGVLYPPRVLPAGCLDAGFIAERGISQDDVYLKIAELMADVPVYCLARPKLQYVEGTQEDGLWRLQGSQGANDRCLHVLLEYFDGLFDPPCDLLRPLRVLSLAAAAGLSAEAEGELAAAQKQLKEQAQLAAKAEGRAQARAQEVERLRASRSFRLGHILTALPRKLRKLRRG